MFSSSPTSSRFGIYSASTESSGLVGSADLEASVLPKGALTSSLRHEHEGQCNGSAHDA